MFRLTTAIFLLILPGLLQNSHASDGSVNSPRPVIWTTPSRDARESMPLGNGDISANAWVEPTGDLCFYIGKTDSWEDNGRLAKVGKIRVRFEPSLVQTGWSLKQSLDLYRGQMVVIATPLSGSWKDAITVRMWVDAHHPVIHVEASHSQPIKATASIEMWRNKPETLPTIELSDVMFDRSKPEKKFAPTIVEPDTLIKSLPQGIGWYHHNTKSVGPRETMKFQDLLESPWQDPLIDRIFGAVVRCKGASRSDDQHLVSPSSTQVRFDVYVLTEQPVQPAAWLASINTLAKRIEAIDFKVRRETHQAWWVDFWNRSYITVTPVAANQTSTDAKDVTRSYAIQRFMTACAGRGAYPIKFNGSTFTVRWGGKPGDADFRAWGPGYFWQQTRHAYAPLYASGDFGLFDSFHRLYGKDLLQICKYRTEKYFGFKDAAYFPESSYIWGASFPDTYGRGKPASARKDKLSENASTKHLWIAGIEFVFMLQDYYEHTQEESFADGYLLPNARAVIRFFDQYYKTGSDGKLIISPAQALETRLECTNPMPEIAGLHAVVERLLALPPEILPAADRQYFTAFQSKIPELPINSVDGVPVLSPAQKYSNQMNNEAPQLYAIYPFRRVSFEKPNASLGIEALKSRGNPGYTGWRQDEIFMAYLGLANPASDYLVKRAKNRGANCRFPGFYGPNEGWTPDQTHGAILMKALQSMIMQTEGDKIFLLPAWPSDWNVDFKLHAPKKTIIRGVVREGRLETLTVTPTSRRADIILPAGFPPPE